MKHLKTWSNNLTDLTDIDRFIIDSLVNRRFKTASYAARYQNARRQQNLYIDGSKAYIDTANFLAEIAKQGGEQVNSTSNASLADAINESAALAKELVDEAPDQWPDESRIDNIGQNGNSGEHYTQKRVEFAGCKRDVVEVWWSSSLYKCVYADDKGKVRVTKSIAGHYLIQSDGSYYIRERSND